MAEASRRNRQYNSLEADQPMQVTGNEESEFIRGETTPGELNNFQVRELHSEAESSSNGDGNDRDAIHNANGSIFCEGNPETLPQSMQSADATLSGFGQGFLVIENKHEYAALLAGDISNYYFKLTGRLGCSNQLNGFLFESSWVRKDAVSHELRKMKHSSNPASIILSFWREWSEFLDSAFEGGERFVGRVLLTFLLSLCLAVRIIVSDMWVFVLYGHKSSIIDDVKAAARDVWAN